MGLHQADPRLQVEVGKCRSRGGHGNGHKPRERRGSRPSDRADSLGMVRLYIKTETLDLPLDFAPEEAEEIAEELLAAAEKARAAASGARAAALGALPVEARQRLPAGAGSVRPCRRPAAERAMRWARARRRAPGSGTASASAEYRRPRHPRGSGRHRPAANRRGTRGRPPRETVASGKVATPLQVRQKSMRLDLHSTIQISPLGPTAITSTRRPGAGTNSMSGAKSSARRPRLTPRASRWPGSRASDMGSASRGGRKGSRR